MFKKKETKVAFNTLNKKDLFHITGGGMPSLGGSEGGDCTCGTFSICHIDGTTDDDN